MSAEEHARLLLLATIRDTWYADITETGEERGWNGFLYISADVLYALAGHEHKSDQEREACRALWNAAPLDASRLAALLDDALEAMHEADEFDQWHEFAHDRDFTEFEHTSPLPGTYPPDTSFSLIRERGRGAWFYRIDQRHQPTTKENDDHA